MCRMQIWGALCQRLDNKLFFKLYKIRSDLSLHMFDWPSLTSLGQVGRSTKGKTFWIIESGFQWLDERFLLVVSSVELEALYGTESRAASHGEKAFTRICRSLILQLSPDSSDDVTYTRNFTIGIGCPRNRRN